MEDNRGNENLDEIEQLLRKIGYVVHRLRAGPTTLEPGSGQEWAERILRQAGEGPTPLEVLVARACVQRKQRRQSLSAILGGMIRELEQLPDHCEVQLTGLLKAYYYADQKNPLELARASSHRFRNPRVVASEASQVFECDSRENGDRFVGHHLDRLQLSQGGSEPRLVIVDVLSREGRQVREVLYRILAEIRQNPETHHVQCLVARVVLQAHDKRFEDEIRSLQHDDSLRAELAGHHIYAWFREVLDATERIRPGLVYGNWISSIPYPVDDRDCATVRRQLWLGETHNLEGLEVHDLYFGAQGSSGGGKDIYNHFAIGGSRAALAMGHWQEQLAGLHGRFWRETVPHGDEPSVIEFAANQATSREAGPRGCRRASAGDYHGRDEANPPTTLNNP
jgi:hypothetical protein